MGVDVEALPEKGSVASIPRDGSNSDGSNELYIDPATQKKLVLKLDLYLAPVMTIIFLAAYLDRANIGNAASAGMTADLGMSSGELGSKLFG
jgi:hypothetical protein